MVAPRNREEELYAVVLAGTIEIDQQGRIWRRAFLHWHKGLQQTIMTPCMRRRAERSSGLGGRYSQVAAMVNGHRIYALAHRLVYRHFMGPIPQGLTINHKNGDPKDNRPENLELATYSEQMIHANRVLGTGGGANQWGETNHQAKLTRANVERIRKRRAAGEKLVPIAEDYGISMQQVSKIARGERWRSRS